MNAISILKARGARPARRPQRGAVAIMFGLMAVVLIAFIGLAIDLGRFFIIKSELQNAMDACALSAASQLKPGANDANALVRAVAYGKVFTNGGVDDPNTGGTEGNDTAIKNRVNFQGTELDLNLLQITFSSTNGPNDTSTYKVEGEADPNTARFVKCEYALNSLPVIFMRVRSALPGQQTVSAWAVASRDAPVAACIPVAVCSSETGTPANNFGYTVGQWITAIDGSSYATGHFGWGSLISGDANQIKGELTGSPRCDVSKSNQVIHGEGLMASLSPYWNTRFGLYANGHGLDSSTAPPDHTGYAYSDAPGGNWPPIPPATQGFNAYSGSNSLSPTVPSFVTATGEYRPYNTETPPAPPPLAVVQPPGFPIAQYPTRMTQTEHQTLGRNLRRIVAAPVVDCSLWAPGGPKDLPVKGFACVLMLNPFDESGPPTAERRKAKLEYLGVASDADSPCAGGAEFAIAPVLTQ